MTDRTFSVLAGLLVALTLLGTVAILEGCQLHSDTPSGPTKTCGDACERLRYLRCEEGEPLAGTTCEEACDYYSHQARGSLVDTNCLSTIASCSQVKTCGK